MDPRLVDGDPVLKGTIDTIRRRLTNPIIFKSGPITEEELEGWLREREPEELRQGVNTTIEHYFTTLAKGDNERADLIAGGLGGFFSSIAPYVYQVEKDFLAWRQENRHLAQLTPGRRSRVSPLAERLACRASKSLR